MALLQRVVGNIASNTLNGVKAALWEPGSVIQHIDPHS